MTERSGDGFDEASAPTGRDYSLVPAERDLTPAVVEEEPDYSSMTLDGLAAAAREAHSLAGASLVTALGHYIKMGDILIVAKTRVAEGEWATWLAEGPCISFSTARNMMRLAYLKDHLPPEAFRMTTNRAGRVVAPSAARALLYLRGLPGPDDVVDRVGLRFQRETPPAVQEEAKKLVRGGLTANAAADLLGIDQKTVRRITDSAYRKRQNERLAAGQRRRKAEAAALREKVRAEGRAARFAGADTATQEAWNLIRRALLAVQAAINGSTGDVARLRETMSHLYKAEEMLDASIKEARMD